MVARTQVPILLLTGFLGAGKTTLLSGWLRAPQFGDAMVIVNELGEVGLDDRLIETSTDAPVLLDNGCACCEAGEDLTATLARLFWDRLHRRIPAFSWVLIETTGIADPFPVLDRIARHPLVGERYRVASVVTVFDAQRGPAQLARHPEVRRQIEAAQVVLLSKTDVASAAEVAAAKAAIASVRADIAVLSSTGAGLAPETVLAALTPAVAHSLADQPPQAAHSANVVTGFVPLPTVSRATLVAALDELMQTFGPAVLRLKGLVRFAPARDWHVVQGAAGEAATITAWPPPRDEPPTGLTFIIQGATIEAVSRCLLAGLGLRGEIARPVAEARL